MPRINPDRPQAFQFRVILALWLNLYNTLQKILEEKDLCTFGDKIVLTFG